MSRVDCQEETSILAARMSAESFQPIEKCKGQHRASTTIWITVAMNRQSGLALHLSHSPSWHNVLRADPRNQQ